MLAVRGTDKGCEIEEGVLSGRGVRPIWARSEPMIPQRFKGFPVQRGF